MVERAVGRNDIIAAGVVLSTDPVSCGWSLKQRDSVWRWGEVKSDGDQDAGRVMGGSWHDPGRWDASNLATDRRPVHRDLIVGCLVPLTAPDAVALLFVSAQRIVALAPSIPRKVMT